MLSIHGYRRYQDWRRLPGGHGWWLYAVPYRCDLSPLQEVPIKPLLEKLSFITSKRNCGAVFRFGYLHVPEADFVLIAESMDCDFQTEFSLDTSAPDTGLEPTH